VQRSAWPEINPWPSARACVGRAVHAGSSRPGSARRARSGRKQPTVLRQHGNHRRTRAVPEYGARRSPRGSRRGRYIAAASVCREHASSCSVRVFAVQHATGMHMAFLPLQCCRIRPKGIALLLWDRLWHARASVHRTRKVERLRHIQSTHTRSTDPRRAVYNEVQPPKCNCACAALLTVFFEVPMPGETTSRDRGMCQRERGLVTVIAGVSRWLQS
jgi:hypothetical protein